MGTQDAQTKLTKLWSLIKDIHIPLFVTVDSDGNLCSRPMATQQSRFDGDLWFFSLSTCRELESGSEHKVNLSYADPFKNAYVSISGVAELVEDKLKYKELWNPIYHGWFPHGFEDPDLRLIRIRVGKAEFWDASQATMVPILTFTDQTADAPKEALVAHQVFAARGT